MRTRIKNADELMRQQWWIKEHWEPAVEYTRRLPRARQPRRCACKQPGEVVMSGGIPTCKRCLACDYMMYNVLGRKAGVPDEYNYFLEVLDGICRELKAGELNMTDDAERARAMAI